jgi:hypothetical protein
MVWAEVEGLVVQGQEDWREGKECYKGTPPSLPHSPEGKKWKIRPQGGYQQVHSFI